MITQVLAMPRVCLEMPDLIRKRCANKRWLLISISSTREEVPSMEELADLKRYGCEGFTVLWFSDLTPEMFDDECRRQYPNLVLFSEQDARQILDFVIGVNMRIALGNFTLVVHCDAGISRSGAVADFLCDYLGLDRERFNKENNIYPNTHVKNILRRVAGMTPRFH